MVIIMDPIKKGKLLVILTIAIIAFGTSTTVASVTNGEAILPILNINTKNETELIAVGDGNFIALTANQDIIQITNDTESKRLFEREWENIINIININNTTNNTTDNITPPDPKPHPINNTTNNTTDNITPPVS
jgi:hypothetical protein